MLEEAFDVLRPFISVGPRALKTSGEVTNETITLENRFAGLTVEDIAHIAEEEGASEEELLVVTSVVLEQDEAEVEEELKFAFGLLLRELGTMRVAACSQWRKYHAQQIDLIVAAMTTDAAIWLVQKAETEFDFVIQRSKKYPTTTHTAWTLLGIFSPVCPKQNIVESQTSGNTFWHTYLGLKYYFDRTLKWNAKGGLPAMVAKDSGDRQLHASIIRALEIAQVGRIGMFGKHPKVWDLVSQGIEHMFHHKTIPLWVTFAVDTLLQSEDILGDYFGRPYVELVGHLSKLVQ